MRIAVTGANGFIGDAILAAGAAAGNSVVAICRRPPSRGGLAPFYLSSLGKDLPADAIRGVDLLVHCAHDMSPGTFTRNVEGTKRWHSQARAAGVRRQLYVTSCSAHATAPSEYGCAKHALEQYFVREDDVALRFGLVIGNGGLFGRMVRRYRTWPVAPVLGSDLYIQITHLRDAVTLVLACVHWASASVINGFETKALSMLDMVTQIRRHFGRKGLLLPLRGSMARELLRGFAVLSPAARRYHSSFLALEQSQHYDYSSSYPSLEMPATDLNEMLAAQFRSGDKPA